MTAPAPGAAQLLGAIRSGARTYAELGQALGTDPEAARRVAQDAADSGHRVRVGPEYVQPWPEARPERPQVLEAEAPAVDGWTGLALIADTHIGSDQAATSELAAWLRYVHGRGVRHVVHAGDLLDGTYWFRSAHLEQVAIGLDRQLSLALDSLPALPGLTYWILGGNHDTNGYWRQAGVDPVGAFVHRGRAEGRSDLRHLGTTVGRLAIGQSDSTAIRIEAAHVEKGAGAYALSYGVQKYAESLAGGSKPDILVSGHLHSYLTAWIRGIWCCLPGCWQWQTEYERRKALSPAVGGVIVWARREPYRLTVSHEWHGLHPREVAWQRSG